MVKNADSVESCICKNPEFISRVEIILAPSIRVSVYSTAAKECVSLYTLWVRFMNIRTLSFFLGTMTMPEYQSVGSVTKTITPSSCMHSSSSFTAIIKVITT